MPRSLFVIALGFVLAIVTIPLEILWRLTMDLARDILDKQVVDRHETKMGKVDGLVAELREGAPPRIASSRSAASRWRAGSARGSAGSSAPVGPLGGAAHRYPLPYRVASGARHRRRYRA